LKKLIRIKLSPEAEEIYNYLNKEVSEVEKAVRKEHKKFKYLKHFKKRKI